MSNEKPIKTYTDYQLYLGSKVRSEVFPCCENECYGVECEEKHKPNFIPVPTEDIPTSTSVENIIPITPLGIIGYGKSKGGTITFNTSEQAVPSIQVANIKSSSLTRINKNRCYKISTKVCLASNSIKGISPQLLIYAGTSVGDDGEIMVGSSATNNLIDTTVGISIKGDGTTSFATFTSSKIINGDALKDKNIKFAINSQNGRDGDNIIVIGETQTNGVRNCIYIEDIGGYIPDLD